MYIYYRRVRSSIGGCFQVDSFFSGLKRLQINFYQNKIQNLFLIILPNYVFVAFLLPTIFLLFKLYQYIVTFLDIYFRICTHFPGFAKQVPLNKTIRPLQPVLAEKSKKLPAPLQQMGHALFRGNVPMLRIRIKIFPIFPE